MTLEGKRIVLGVTGSIAAYKAAILVRALVKEGAAVRVVMTPLAKQFIAPLTLATLSRHPVPVEFFNPENGEWNSHVSLGEWADLLLIAPATANTIAKMAAGVAYNLLLTTYLSAKCPVMVAPAMDLDMYRHPATQRNLDALRAVGNRIVEPGDGELASGLVGKGRMEEPEAIAAHVRAFFAEAAPQPLAGKRLLVTAGGTVERLDPVRYITNDSTGKMGFAIAEELAARGAEVALIRGKVSVSLSAEAKASGRVRETVALSAEEMHRACLAEFPHCDGGVMCAAVADYAPVETAPRKLKKQEERWSLELRRTPDIGAELGAAKGNRVLAGFALETDRELENAAGKLRRKGLDFIVLNSLRDAGAGFGFDTNKISVLRADGTRTDYPLKPKREAAADIADVLEACLAQRQGAAGPDGAAAPEDGKKH